MKTFNQVYKTLRQANRKNYWLLAGCCFFSVLLITAYVTMMYSPTILTVLPEGGDSRRQAMMIFVLAILGCAVFTCYAAGLFFRSKSKDTGLFLALGAPKKLLRNELIKELALIAFGSCGVGALLGAPLAWVLWQFFRTLVVDSQEMIFSLDPTAYLYALAFAAFVTLMLQWMGSRFIRRTNIIQIVNESRISEPIHDVPKWYSYVGIGLILLGGFLGYIMPSVIITQLKWYPPEALTAVFYLPLFVGLYMILLHTVVNGWRGGKSIYRHIIATSMMKFQGRQTVRNMLVITLLIAGAYFASFYTPILSSGSYMTFQNRPADYAFHYRADQDLPSQEEIQKMADEEGVLLTSWVKETAAVLVEDGMVDIETETKLGTTYTEEYNEKNTTTTYFSESSFNALTGLQIDVPSGQVASVFTDDMNGLGMFDDNISLITNIFTGDTLPVTPMETSIGYTMLLGHRVLDDADYARISAGLPKDWQEEHIFFNVADVDASYAFAKRLFHEIINRSSQEVALIDAWDPIVKQNIEAAGKIYAFDTEHLEENGFPNIDYNQCDSSSFRMYWKYMPQFRVMDQAEFVKTTAVYLMLFVFISIICFAAVLVIGYTRCLQLAMSNQQVYEDLRRLGAGRNYLYQSVKGQISRVWFVPILVGTLSIMAFYTTILFFNDGQFSPGELVGMGYCGSIIAAVSLLLFVFYRFTLKKVCSILKVA